MTGFPITIDHHYSEVSGHGEEHDWVDEGVSGVKPLEVVGMREENRHIEGHRYNLNNFSEEYFVDGEVQFEENRPILADFLAHSQIKQDSHHHQRNKKDAGKLAFEDVGNEDDDVLRSGEEGAEDGKNVKAQVLLNPNYFFGFLFFCILILIVHEDLVFTRGFLVALVYPHLFLSFYLVF